MKALSAESTQGAHEFLTEIDTISNVRHPNLVELIGCCVEGANRILVYEYLENNSLDAALLGNSKKLVQNANSFLKILIKKYLNTLFTCACRSKE